MSLSTTLFPQQITNVVRVLVVVHDITILSFILNICNENHYQVATCSAASLAEYILKETKDGFDLILVDAQMPGLNPNDFVKRVKQQFKIPIILISDDGSESSRKKAYENGVDEFCRKPLNQDLITHMWSCVHKKNAGKENKQQDQSLSKRTTMSWTPALFERFKNAVDQLDINKAKPREIVKIMNVPGLTQKHVASRLQKYRDSKRASKGLPIVRRKRSKRVSNETQPTSRPEQILNVPVDSLIQCDNNVHAEHNYDQDTNTVTSLVSLQPRLEVEVEVVPLMQQEQNLIVTSDSLNQYDNLNVPVDSLIQCDNNVHAEHNDDQDINTVASLVSLQPRLEVEVEVVPLMQQEQNLIVTPDSLNQYDNLSALGSDYLDPPQQDRMDSLNQYSNYYLPDRFADDLDPQEMDSMLESVQPVCEWEGEFERLVREFERSL